MRVEWKTISASSPSRSIARRVSARRSSYSPRVIANVSIGATIAGAAAILCSFRRRVIHAGNSSREMNREGAKDAKTGEEKKYLFSSSLHRVLRAFAVQTVLAWADGDADAVHEVPHAAARELSGARRLGDIGRRAG